MTMRSGFTSCRNALARSHTPHCLAQRGRQLAELIGEIVFPEGLRLVVYERLTWDVGELLIEGYGYEVWRSSEKPYWYDSQPFLRTLHWPARILITSTSRLISSITACPLPA